MIFEFSCLDIEVLVDCTGFSRVSRIMSNQRKLLETTQEKAMGNIVVGIAIVDGQ